MGKLGPRYYYATFILSQSLRTRRSSYCTTYNRYSCILFCYAYVDAVFTCLSLVFWCSELGVYFRSFLSSFLGVTYGPPLGVARGPPMLLFVSCFIVFCGCGSWPSHFLSCGIKPHTVTTLIVRHQTKTLGRIGHCGWIFILRLACIVFACTGLLVLFQFHATKKRVLMVSYLSSVGFCVKVCAHTVSVVYCSLSLLLFHVTKKKGVDGFLPTLRGFLC